MDVRVHSWPGPAVDVGPSIARPTGDPQLARHSQANCRCQANYSWPGPSPVGLGRQLAPNSSDVLSTIVASESLDSASASGVVLYCRSIWAMKFLISRVVSDFCEWTCDDCSVPEGQVQVDRLRLVLVVWRAGRAESIYSKSAEPRKRR